MIHVARDGAKLGEFTLEQIQAGLGTGQFRPTDLGWQSGMAEWRPLSEFVASTASAAPSQPVAVAAASTAAAGPGLPWERRAQIGFVKAWFDTVSLLITKPGDAFTMMKTEGGLGDPLFFGMIGGSAGTIVSILFQIGLQSITGARNSLTELIGLGPVIALLLLSPLWLACFLFIGSGILHLCLMLLGGASRPYETTFRVVCYSCGATQLFSLIPFCGGYISGIYNVVLECIGLTRAQQTTTGKALFAIFLPMIVCCGLIILIAIMAGGFGALGGYFNRH